MIRSKQYIILVSFIILLLPISLKSSNVHSIFEMANHKYQNEEYNEAIKLYDSIENQGYISSAIHFNRGNSYYKLNNFPKAILYFERAKLIDGGKNDIISNLEISNAQIIDKIEPLPEMLFFKIWYQIVDAFNSKIWTLISIVLAWLFVACLVAFYISRRYRTLLLLGILFFFFSTISVGYVSFKKHKFESKHNFAIIFSPTEYLKSAPDKKSTDLFLIHEGLKVEIIEQLDNWYKVKLVDGKVGWIDENSSERI